MSLICIKVVFSLFAGDSSNNGSIDFFNTVSEQNVFVYNLTNALPIGLDINLTLLLGLSFSCLVFLIGLFGILWNLKNIIIVFLCVELMLFGAGLQFLFYFLFFKYILGQIFALLILTVATAETAIGLGIIILAYRLNRSISFEAFSVLRS